MIGLCLEIRDEIMNNKKKHEKDGYSELDDSRRAIGRPQEAVACYN